MLCLRVQVSLLLDICNSFLTHLPASNLSPLQYSLCTFCQIYLLKHRCENATPRIKNTQYILLPTPWYPGYKLAYKTLNDQVTVLNPSLSFHSLLLHCHVFPFAKNVPFPPLLAREALVGSSPLPLCLARASPVASSLYVARLFLSMLLSYTLVLYPCYILYPTNPCLFNLYTTRTSYSAWHMEGVQNHSFNDLMNEGFWCPFNSSMHQAFL